MRAALNSREPGDEITFTVIQRGERNVVKVPLEAYDASRMMTTTLQGGSIPFPQPNMNLFGAPNANTQLFGNLFQVDPQGGARVFVGSDPNGIKGIYQLPKQVGPGNMFPNNTTPGVLNQMDIARLQSDSQGHATDMADHLSRIDDRIANLEKLLESLVTSKGGTRP